MKVVDNFARRIQECLRWKGGQLVLEHVCK